MKIAVLGGGIAGTAAAFEIARQGEHPAVYFDHSGSSGLYSGALDFEAWDRVSDVVAIDDALAQFATALGVWELGAKAQRVAADHAAGLELLQAGLDGPARDVEAARGLHQAQARLVAQERDEAGVEVVDGHVAQSVRGWAGQDWSKCVFGLGALA